MIKKRSILLSLLLVVFTLCGTAAAKGPVKAPPVEVLVNGRVVSFPDAGPFIDNQGRTQVPARYVAQELGAGVVWDEATATAVISGFGVSITLVPGRNTATVNGKEVNLDSGALLMEDRIYVPVRFIAETLGASVQWDEARKTVTITDLSKIIEFEGLSLTGYNQDLRFAPDGNKAVFSAYSYPADESKGINSYLLLLDTGKGAVTVLDEGDFFRALEWDAGGKNLLYMKDGSLWRVSVPDGEKATVAENTYYGTFSPDGRYIAYVQGRNGLWVCDAVDGSKKRLAETTDDWYPIWYPDSLHLFYFNDLGQELGDGAGHLQGMARISIADGRVENILPKKTGKFRQAEWIVPGSSLHVVSGWDDGYYQHIVNLDEGTITDLGENVAASYVTAVDRAGGRLLKAGNNGAVEIYDDRGTLQTSFDLGQEEPFYFSASFIPDGQNASRYVLLLRGERPGSGETEQRKIIIFDTETGSYDTPAGSGGIYEACFWSEGDREVLAMVRKNEGSYTRFSGFTELPVQGAGEPKQPDPGSFVPVSESALSAEESAFVEESRLLKGVHQKGELVVFALGPQPNPGYGVELVKSEMSWEQLKVYVRLTRPEPGKMYAAVITYPYIAGKAYLPPYTTIRFINAETGETL